MPILLSAMGDLFLRAPDGSIGWLRTGIGQWHQVASSLGEFNQLMTQPDKIGEWFSPRLVGILKAQGKKLGPGQCYGYINPPCLGGRHDATHVEPTDICVHFGMLGQVAAQAGDLPATAA
jgi:hypothetical protein